jgi:hypothetical protein
MQVLLLQCATLVALLCWGELPIASSDVVDKDQFVESGKDFCWRTSYGRGVGVPPSRCPGGYPEKCGLANARQQCCESCPKGYTRMKWPHKNTCKTKAKGKPVHKVVTKKTNALCPTNKPDLSSGLCYQACDKGFKSDGAAMCWSKPPDLDYGWIECGLGAARNVGTCVTQIGEAVAGALETALFIVSFGKSSAVTTQVKAAAKGGANVKKGVKAWSQMSKMAKAKYLFKLTQDPVMAGKRLAKALGRVEKVGKTSAKMLKLRKFFAGMKLAKSAIEGVKALILKVRKGLKMLWDGLKEMFLRVYGKIKSMFKSKKVSKPTKFGNFMKSLGDKYSSFKKYTDEASKMAQEYGDEMYASIGADPNSFVNKQLNDAREKLKKIKKNVKKQTERNDEATEVDPLDFLPDNDVHVDVSLNNLEPLEQLSPEDAMEIAEGLCFLYPERNTSMAIAYLYGDMEVMFAMQNITLVSEESDREVYEESEDSYPTDEKLAKTKNIDTLDDYFALTSEGTKYVSRMNTAWNDYKRWDSSLTDKDRNACKCIPKKVSYEKPY